MDPRDKPEDDALGEGGGRLRMTGLALHRVTASLSVSFGVIAGLVPVIHVSAGVEVRNVRGRACLNAGLSVWRDGFPGQARG